MVEPTMAVVESLGLVEASAVVGWNIMVIIWWKHLLWLGWNIMVVICCGWAGILWWLFAVVGVEYYGGYLVEAPHKKQTRGREITLEITL